MAEKQNYYRVKTVAQMLDVSKGHIWNMVRAGKFTRIKLSPQVTVLPAQEVEDYMKAIRGAAA